MLITVQPNPSWQLSLAQLRPSLFLTLFSCRTRTHEDARGTKARDQSGGGITRRLCVLQGCTLQYIWQPCNCHPPPPGPGMDSPLPPWTLANNSNGFRVNYVFPLNLQAYSRTSDQSVNSSLSVVFQ